MQGSTVIKLLGAVMLGALVGDVSTARAAPDGSLYAIHGSACVGHKVLDRGRTRHSTFGVNNENPDGKLTVHCPGTYVSGADVYVSGRAQSVNGVWMAPSCHLSVVNEFGATVVSPFLMKPSRLNQKEAWEATGRIDVGGVFSVECGLDRAPPLGSTLLPATVSLVRAF